MVVKVMDMWILLKIKPRPPNTFHTHKCPCKAICIGMLQSKKVAIAFKEHFKLSGENFQGNAKRLLQENLNEREWKDVYKLFDVTGHGKKTLQ